jgi:DNA-binding PadR family transcriptional regulator
MMVTYDAMRVMREFLMARDPRCGAEIMRALKMQSGTVYPMLARMKNAGWLEFVETLPSPDQPPSHFYRLSPAGRAAFLDMLCKLTIPDHLWREPAFADAMRVAR